jgi:RNA polymerase sigma-70 factor, ECF subfamily
MTTPTAPVWTEIISELRKFVYHQVNDRDLANDIVQDVLVKVQTRAGQLRESEKLMGWIHQVTRNTITDHFRARKRELSVPDLQWDSHYHELNDCVAHCLTLLMDTLPEKYREAVRLTELENLSQTELAHRLNISYSGAKSRVQRGRQLLREKLLAQYEIETDGYGNVIVCEDKLPCGCDTEYHLN